VTKPDGEKTEEDYTEAALSESCRAGFSTSRTLTAALMREIQHAAPGQYRKETFREENNRYLGSLAESVDEVALKAILARHGLG